MGSAAIMGTKRAGVRPRLARKGVHSSSSLLSEALCTWADNTEPESASSHRERGGGVHDDPPAERHHPTAAGSPHHRQDSGRQAWRLKRGKTLHHCKKK